MIKTCDILKTYDNIRKIVQGDDYTAGYLLGYPYFKKYYKLIEIALRKQQKCWSKSNRAKWFYWKSKQTRRCNKFFIIKEAKEIVLDFSKGAVKVLKIYFVLI